MANICTVCNYPIKKPNRTTHVSCASQAAPDDQPIVSETIGTAFDKRECCFCHSRDTVLINGAPFCPEHEPVEQAPTKVRSRETLTFAAERCPRCGEAITPSITKGNIKCKCDQPKMPRHLRNNDSDDRPPMSVRYGN